MAAESKAASINAWLGVATGLLTVLTLAASLFGLNKSQQASDSQEQASVVSSSAASQQNAADVTISSLLSENSVLSSQLLATSSASTVPITTTTPTISTPVAPTGATHHSGRLTLAYGGDGADLDSSEGDSRWVGDGNKDVNYGPGIGALYLANAVKGLVLPEGISADFNTCDTSGYVSARIVVAGLQPGAGYCIITEDGRIAAMTLVSVDGANLVADVVVYS